MICWMLEEYFIYENIIYLDNKYYNYPLFAIDIVYDKELTQTLQHRTLIFDLTE